MNVKRALNACDRHNDGFISLTDLRAVLSAFTVPMSEQLFIQLMERSVLNTIMIKIRIKINKINEYVHILITSAANRCG